MVQFGGRVGAEEIVEVEAGVRAELSKAAQVPDRRVEPHVEVFSGRVRDLKSEIRIVARDVPVLQSLGEPFVQLSRHGRRDGAAADPFTQLWFECAQTEKIMLGFAFDGFGAADRGYRIDEVRGRVGRAADLARISILIG